MRRLIKLGISPKTAWKTVYEGRRRTWDLSHKSAVDRALPKAYFAERGLFSPVQWWEDRWARVIAPVPIQLTLELG